MGTIIDWILAILYVLLILVVVLIIIALAIPVGALYGIYYLVFLKWRN